MRLSRERSLSARGLRWRVAVAAVIAAAVVTTSGASVVSAANPWTLRDARAITHWNKIAVDLIIAQSNIGASARAFNYFAYEQAAVYNAVQGITRQYQLYQWSRLGPRTASPAAAASAAAHRLLVHYFPGSKAALDAKYAAAIARIPAGAARRMGIAYGRLAADNIIELRANDGVQDSSVTFTVGSGPGAWQPQPGQTFLAPWLSKVHPFTLNSTSQFDPGVPYGAAGMSSAAYTADFNEVKAKGGQATGSRTDKETETARFIFDIPFAPLHAGLRDLAWRHRLNISDSARMFAAVDMSAADAIGAVWHSKVKYGFWRPVTAIRNAGTDGNPDTAPDGTWTSVLPNPPYPDWVAGLPSVMGAVGRALHRTIGADIDLKLTSPGSAPGGPVGVPITRRYHSAAALNTDVINARVWSGIHFRTSDVLGNRIGIRTANWALNHYFGHN